MKDKFAHVLAAANLDNFQEVETQDNNGVPYVSSTILLKPDEELYKFDPAKNTIWVDLDGVLVDFDRWVSENLNITSDVNSTDKTSQAYLWQRIRQVERFYFNLPPTAECFELFGSVRKITDNVRILTAIPKKTRIPGAEKDKREWVEKYLYPEFGHVPFSIGPFSVDKWKHCSPGDILIDDKRDNIKDWESQGGVGLLHLDWNATKFNLFRLNHIVTVKRARGGLH